MAFKTVLVLFVMIHIAAIMGMDDPREKRTLFSGLYGGYGSYGYGGYGYRRNYYNGLGSYDLGNNGYGESGYGESGYGESGYGENGFGGYAYPYGYRRTFRYY